MMKKSKLLLLVTMVLQFLCITDAQANQGGRKKIRSKAQSRYYAQPQAAAQTSSKPTYTRPVRPTNPTPITGQGRTAGRTTQRGGTVSATVTPTSGSGKNGTYAVTTSSQGAHGIYSGSTTGTVTTSTAGATPTATGSSTTTLSGPAQTKSDTRSTTGTATGGAYGSGTASYQSTTTNSDGQTTRTGYTANTAQGMTQGGTKYGPNGGTRTFASNAAYAGSPTEAAYTAGHTSTTTSSSGDMVRQSSVTAGWSDATNPAPTHKTTTTNTTNGNVRYSEMNANGNGTVSGNSWTEANGHAMYTNYNAPRTESGYHAGGYGSTTSQTPLTPEQKTSASGIAQSKGYDKANVGTGANAVAGVNNLMANNS